MEYLASFQFCKAVRFDCWGGIIIIMQARLHKAKLITVHNKIVDPEDKSAAQASSTAIHAYMTLLKQLIQNNKHHIKSLSESTSSNIKMSSPSLRRKASKNWLVPLKGEATGRKKSFREYCNNRQQIINSIKQKNKQLISVNSLSKLQSKGNISQRIQRNIQKEFNCSFIPIGKIYHQLKHKTEQAAQEETEPSLCLKSNQLQYRKRCSIYPKQTRSIQRNVFKQQKRSSNVKMPIELTTRSAFQQAKMAETQNSFPQPW